MDTQNNNDNSNASSNGNQETDTNVDSTNSPQDLVQPMVIEQHKSHKWFYIIVSLLVTLGLAAGAWAYVNSSEDTPMPTTANSTTTQPSVNNLQPTSVVYSFSENQNDPAQLFTRPLSGGERESAKTIKSRDYITHSDVYKYKVLVATAGGFGSSNETAIWYSEDAGMTYEKIFSEIPTNASETEMGSQITSARFSTDGSAIVFALLPADRGNNTVKEISLQTKIKKDLFDLSTAGVFVEAYNRDAKRVFYYTGCYNCDGNPYNKLFTRNLSNDTESVVYETTSNVGVQTVLNEDQTKALIVSGVSGESLGANPPYAIEEFDVASKKFKTIATINKENVPTVGYAVNGTPYYSDGTKVFSVTDKGEPITIFEDTQPIRAVYLVSDNTVVAHSGTHNNFKLTNYSLTLKEATIVLNGDSNTRILGITWK